MAVTISPSTEACEALVAQINAGTLYTLHVAAVIAEQFSDDQQDMDELAVDVVTLDSEQLEETLDLEDRSTHTIGIEVRKRLENDDQVYVDDLKLTVQQIFQRVNNFRSTAGRVRVWNVADVKNENPNKQLLAEGLVFRSRLTLRVEVEAS